MFGKSLDHQKPLRPIRAATINAALDELERLGQIRSAAPVSIRRNPAGTLISHDVARPIWALILSDTSPHSWKQQLEQPDGTWIDGYLSDNAMAQPAYNTISGVTLPSPFPIVELTPALDGTLRFTAGTC